MKVKNGFDSGIYKILVPVSRESSALRNRFVVGKLWEKGMQLLTSLRMVGPGSPPDVGGLSHFC